MNTEQFTRTQRRFAAFFAKRSEPIHLYPKIVLTDCPYCVAGRKRFVLNGRTIDQECANCAGRGTIVTEAVSA